MFTIEQVRAAHSKIKSGADFPAYIRDIKELGVTAYTTFVNDGHTVYEGENDYQTSSPARYANRDIAAKANEQQLKHYLSIHQQGQTDYPTFCRQAAETGIEKWFVCLTDMTCTYYDKAGGKVLVEKIAGSR